MSLKIVRCECHILSVSFYLILTVFYNTLLFGNDKNNDKNNITDGEKYRIKPTK